MPFSWQYGVVNAQGSINRFFMNNITANGLPSFMTGVGVYFDFPQGSLTGLPAFSVIHLEGETEVIAEGDIIQGSPSAMIGRRVWGMLEIDCWNTIRLTGGTRNNSAIMQLRSMIDMVHYMFNSARRTPILDVYTNTANPASVSALIRFGDIRHSEIMVDPEPNIRRIRMTVDYNYVERQSMS